MTDVSQTPSNDIIFKQPVSRELAGSTEEGHHWGPDAPSPWTLSSFSLKTHKQEIEPSDSDQC